MRTLSLSLSGLLATTLLAACGGTPGGAMDAVKKKNESYRQINNLPQAKQRAKARELAAEEDGKLSLYTSMTSDIVGPMTKAFEEKYDIEVNVFRGNSETVLQRAMQEQQAAHPGADVIETNFQEMAVLAKEESLADYTGPALKKIPKVGRFPHWTASRFNIFQPAWNTDLIKSGDVPRRWEDLALPKYKGKLALELSDSDWYENVTQYWRKHGKSRAEIDKLWRAIAKNASVTKGHTTMMQFLTAGQTPLQAMNYTYITDRAADDGAPVTHLPKNGKSTVPAFARPNGVGLVGNAQHPAAAWLFYDWLLTEGQQILVDQHLSPAAEVPGDHSRDGLTLAPFDVQGLTRNSSAWDKKYDDLLRGVDQVGK